MAANNNTLSCPVDFVPVNENKTRWVAAQVLVLAIVYLATGVGTIFAFLSVDFFFRGFGLNKFSLIDALATTSIKTLKIGNKQVDRAPKRFAAKVGFVFSTVITALHFAGFVQTAMLLTTVLCLFALLESGFAICVGCYMYTIIKRLGLIKE